ncbi:hypothetical protein H924_02100 [Corynebacterium callunae DSM 20147]|uniref:DUF2254 domain-containing protein n=1 Tax=Corynebacterium callunae DSM 20147 TaxID=1121353 RepID=M1UJ98_9CORY|nr:hypothetical protein H924_02100 [Corynebacterium callunae DSM 20147]
MGISGRLRLAMLSYRFEESLFLYPALIMSGGIVLAVVATVVDDALGHGTRVPLTLTMSSNAATWLLATVAGAMITTVGVVFSLTVVSLQLASDQFSPRVMRSFIRDRLSQRVIGLLVSLTVAVILTLITVAGIIVHLDHLAHGLQVGNVARGIAREGEAVASALDDVPAGMRQVDPRDFRDIPAEAVLIDAPSSGWISQVDLTRVFAVVPPGTVVRMETRVGAYIHSGEPLFTVWPEPDHRSRRRLAAAIEVSEIRTMLQDVDFAIRQLVDIGLRALSPAVNDPTTAVEVILRLGSLMRTVLTTSLAPPALQDDADRVLVQPWNLSHEEYVAHAFDQLRQMCLDQTEVAAALLRVLRMLGTHVREEGNPDLEPVLHRQMQLLFDGLERQPDLHPEDLRRLRALTSGDTDPADHSR